MQEEGRHILFFVNWVAWHRRNLALWRRPIFWVKILAVWDFLVWERVASARGFGGAGDGGAGVLPRDHNFTLPGCQSWWSASNSISARVRVSAAHSECRFAG